MNNHPKYRNGAFVFTRMRKVEPRTPVELEQLVATHGIDSTIVPLYAGDRAAVVRAVASAKAGLAKKHLLLRPIIRSSTALVYGIVSEQTDVVDEKLEHQFEATVAWSAEPQPEVIHGDHAVAHSVRGAYDQLRGKVVAEDWSASITSFIESLDAARLRPGVYWVPPQRLDSIRFMCRFLADVGIDLVACEVDAEAEVVVQQVAAVSLDAQLEQLQAEVAEFDGTQKPSTYTRRLEKFQRLRERACLYRDALGIGVTQAEAALAELEGKVEQMLELRSATVMPCGLVASADAAVSATDVEAIAVSEPMLKFAGGVFTLKAEIDGAALFTSDSTEAQAKIEMLERMRVAGVWQDLGAAEVLIKNSGPPGECVSIRIRTKSKRDICDCARSLASIGIEIN